jgi:hypothetical protein
MSTRSTGQQGLFRKKPVEAFVSETRPDAEGGVLERSIGLFQLTMFGVGATIGTGIFIVLTEAVPFLPRFAGCTTRGAFAATRPPQVVREVRQQRVWQTSDPLEHGYHTPNVVGPVVHHALRESS